MSNLDNMKGNRVLVVGFGRSGQAAARVMARMGAEVSVQDAKKESQIDSNLLTFYRGTTRKSPPLTGSPQLEKARRQQPGPSTA